MSEEFQKIHQVLDPYRKEIIHHKVYKVIHSLEDLQVFMRYHIYAVWDFMSLLKALQMNLTCTTLPWLPVGSGSTRALINEIVAGEESDVDANGEKKSHFEMYLDAMKQCQASTSEIDKFISALTAGQSLEQAFIAANTPQAAADFVRFTFSLIDNKQPHHQAAAFTFGREDLIPDMFHHIVTDLNQKFPGQISLFKYYLDRHIEVDGDHHSHLALEMTAELCGDEQDRWSEARHSSEEALRQRILLWDAAYDEITSKSNGA